jgi:hypothetical protein
MVASLLHPPHRPSLPPRHSSNSPSEHLEARVFR